MNVLTEVVHCFEMIIRLLYSYSIAILEVVFLAVCDF